jgi:hypothetical protein
MSVYLLVFNGSTPLGNLFTGWLASLVGISLTLIVNASASLLAAVVGWLKRGRAEGDLRRTLR